MHGLLKSGICWGRECFKHKEANNRNRETRVAHMQAAGWRQSRCRTTARVMGVREAAHVSVWDDKGWQGWEGLHLGWEVTLFSGWGIVLQLTHRGRPGQLRQLPYF